MKPFCVFSSSDPLIHGGENQQMLDNVTSDTQFIDEVRSHMQVALVIWVIVVSHIIFRGELGTDDY